MSTTDSFIAASHEQFERLWHRLRGASVPKVIASCFSPGRINLIGEHVDYMGGRVLPAAVDVGTCVLVAVDLDASSSPSHANDASSSPSDANDDSAASVVTIWCPAQASRDGAHMSYTASWSQLTRWADDVASIYDGVADVVAARTSTAAVQFRKRIAEECKVVSWAAYVIGALVDGIAVGRRLGRASKPLPPGAVVFFAGNVPIGAGLSSSAALCVALVSAIGYASSDPNSVALAGSPAAEQDSHRTAIALRSQQIEHRFCGVFCGIMDQYASLHGKPGALLEVDCAALTHIVHPVGPLFAVRGPVDDAWQCSLWLVNSMVQHQLGEEYNAIRREMAEAVAAIGHAYAHGAVAFDVVAHARAARRTPATCPVLEPFREAVASSRAFAALEHVASEVQRTDDFIAVLHHLSHVTEAPAVAADCKHLGQLLDATHESLATRLHVSTEHLDFVHDTAAKLSTDSRDCRCLGSRMMGGGFGGCVLLLIESRPAPHPACALFFQELQNAFRDRYQLTCAVYGPVLPVAGTIVTRC